VTQDNLWLRQLAQNPGHSRDYVQRFRDLAANGADLAGEGRLIDAMVSRGARILDAGCGTGRIGGYLAGVGHQVTGVDLDPVLIAEANAQFPASTWLVGDLAGWESPGPGFDIVVCGGNVMAFLAPATRVEVLRRFAAHLATGGRAVIGFGAGRGYEFDDFRADAKTAGLREGLLLATWDLRPFTGSADFLVAVLTRA
jgi:SAM-dependent methyltransferase